MLPIYTPLPDPAAPDPADLTDFQTWCAANLPDLESALDAAGNELVSTGAGMNAAAAVMDAMGTDLATAFDTLASYATEEDADTFQLELAAAAAQDAALAALANDVNSGAGGVLTAMLAPANPAVVTLP